MNTANATLLFATQHAVGIETPLDLLNAMHTAHLACCTAIGASPAFDYHEPGQLRLAFELADLCAEYEHMYGHPQGAAMDFMRGEGLESVNEMIEHITYCLED